MHPGLKNSYFELNYLEAMTGEGAVVGKISSSSMRGQMLQGVVLVQNTEVETCCRRGWYPPSLTV